MDIAEAANLAVAGGTFLLAVATFRLATEAKEQTKISAEHARLTEEMLNVASRQLDASSRPMLTVDVDTPGFVTDGRVTVFLRNDGAAAAQIVRASFANLSLDPRLPTRIEAGDSTSIVFEAGGWAAVRGETTRLVVTYSGGDGGERKLTCPLKWKGERFAAGQQATVDA